jgi:hypothetical protein
VEPYVLVGPGHCKGVATFSSPAWALLKLGEPQTRATGDPLQLMWQYNLKNQAFLS